MQKMQEFTKVTSTRITNGERYGLVHSATRNKRDMSEQVAAYVQEGLLRDGYAPDESGKWVRQ